MEIISTFLDLVLHLDKHLSVIVQNHGPWAYGIFFLVIFAETGLVATPFLPGDSLLFGLGVFVAADSLNIYWLFIILSMAAILGDSVNYAIGKYIGLTLLERNKIRFIKEAHIKKTENFYKKYGPKTIVLARFIPIVRTFAPFVAGISKMQYIRFFTYNCLGGILWIAIFLFSGYYLGGFKLVKENLNIVILLIIFLSIMPGVVEFFRHRQKQ